MLRRSFIGFLSAVAGNKLTAAGEGVTQRTIASPRTDLSVADFDAVGDGLADDTAAVRAAIAAAVKAGGGRVVFPVGTYRITDTIRISSFHVHMQGAGMGASVLYFDPPTAKSCIRFQAVGGGLIARSGISDFSFDSPRNAVPKVAIEVVDGSDISIFNIACTEESWDCPGGTGLLLRGRELISVERFTFASEQPIRIAANPGTPYIGLDMSTFRQIYLIGRGKEQKASLTTRPLFQIDGDCVVTNLTIDGLVCARGSYGLYWRDATTKAIAQNIDIRGFRREQSPASAVNNYSFLIARGPMAMYNLRLQNFSLGGHKSTSPTNGIYLDGIRHGTLDGSMYEGDGLGLTIQAEDFAWRGCYWAFGSQLKLLGKTKLQNASFSPGESRSIPSSGRAAEG